jgi:predicted Zn finger-like uncharacterized protein
MEVLCPHCHFSQQVDASALPPLPCKVTCPQCAQRFTLSAPPAEAVTPPDIVSPPPVEVELPPLDETPPPLEASAASSAAPIFSRQPAGFWVRALAAIIDSMVCNLVVFVMSLALGMLLNLTNSYMSNPGQLLLMTMGLVVTVFYYVFFTGYCGQTPGKMVLSIKVIHNDGGSVGYGQVFVRETIGKTISSLVFGIGYLMVAFRSDKRGLHDLLAATKVIKL